MKAKTLRKWIALFTIILALSLFTGASIVALLTLANYNEAVDKTVMDIRKGNPIETNQDLVSLHYFYDLSRQWKVGWLTDKYLFQDAHFYETSDVYLIRDWQKVIDGLKDRQDDVRSYPYGNAKFRRAQARYRVGETKEALNTVLTEVASDYEKALRNCLDSDSAYGKCFDRVWNYDIATNKDYAEEALKNPGKSPRFILGPIRDKNGQPIPIEKGPKKGGQDGKEEGGAGSPRKRP